MKLYISKNLGFDQDKTRLASEFILFCAEHLPIENPFEIHLVTNREQHGIGTTAVYEVGNNCCKIYCKNRAFVDILRSAAHEMTHMMQDEMGLLVGKIRDAGGFHEDQANAKAGELIKLFAKSKEDRKAIYESKYFLIKEMKKASYQDPEDLRLDNMSNDTDGGGGVNPFKDNKKIAPYIKSGVSFEKVSSKIVQIIEAVYKEYEENYKKEYPNLPPVVTSIFRGPESQAKTMFGNWKMHGGKKGVSDNKGNKYLINLYKDKEMAKKVGDIFTQTGSYKDVVPIFNKKRPSSHGLGNAVDFRSNGLPYMEELLKTVAGNLSFMKILDERKKKDGTTSPNQHWHISLK